MQNDPKLINLRFSLCTKMKKKITFEPNKLTGYSLMVNISKFDYWSKNARYLRT